MPQQRFLPDAAITVAIDEIQGDVIIGLQKKAEVFVFFEIRSPARFRADLATILGDVTFARAVKEIEQKKPGPFLGLNIAFSRVGYEKLGLIKPRDHPLLDEAFVQGALARGPRLADRPDDDWLASFKEPIDGVLLVTAWGVEIAGAVKVADDQANAFIDALRASTTVVRKESGLIREAQPGHEHFGFADGVSQPGVLGLTAPGAKPDEGFPGQDLVKPGDFVLGNYAKESDNPAAVSTPPLPWMANGSYMVFRRLNQDVPAFNAYVAANAAPGDEVRLAARLVGRWTDGSPVVLSPVAPNPALDASNPDTNNDFEFGGGDPHQEKCPFASHIRKVYPRKDLDPESERRRILRAGIPFGTDEDLDKGLLFVCYQASIVDKFEFIQSNWANNVGFVPGMTTVEGTPIDEPGHDFIIGQPGPRRADPTSSDAKPEKLDGAAQFVTCTGAAYFFTPSRSALLAITQG